MNRDKKRGVTRLLVLSVIGVVLLSTAAWAGLLPNLSVFKTAVEVSDEELANMRGRFASRGRVVYFGVEMYTEWETAKGKVYTSGLDLSVRRGKSHFRPTISIVRVAKVDKVDKKLAKELKHKDKLKIKAEISEGGLKDTKGVTQVVQVTGDTNKVRNGITLTIRTGTGSPTGETAATDLPESGPVAATTDSGVVAVASVDKNSLSVEITVPGQGIAKQSITSLAGLRQSVRLTGDMNNITNRLNLTAEFRAPNAGRVSATIRSALQGMRGLPQAGLY